MNTEHWWNDSNKGKREVLGDTLGLRATLPTTNPTWSGPVWKACLRTERPATNRLSGDMAFAPSHTVILNSICNTVAVCFLVRSHTALLHIVQ